ncbi:squalene/phytoene synthase family protein [uncultured Sphingomonas sp.]|uniref:squalene/phytoene synthase family protein n=1 Tax=uncultured Sphingomonas sp. TaxID=158754 RepID=UPI0035CBC156
MAETTGDPERDLALHYAPAAARAGLAALFALDARLGAIVRTTTDVMVGQLRLTWWFEALERLDSAPPPAEPVLTALAAHVLPAGASGAALAGMVAGWEALLDGERLDEHALATFGRERGGRLFTAAAAVLGGDDPRVAGLGEGWALADLAAHWREGETRATASRLARTRLAESFGRPWAGELRALGALGLLARSDLAGGRAAAPGRVGRLLMHRLTGR